MSKGWVPIEDWQGARTENESLTAALAHANQRLNRTEAALSRIKGMCELRDVSNMEIMGYKDDMTQKILAVIERAI